MDKQKDDRKAGDAKTHDEDARKAIASLELQMVGQTVSMRNALKVIVNKPDTITPAKRSRKNFEVDRRPLRVVNTDSLSSQITSDQATETKLSPIIPTTSHISFDEDKEITSRGRELGRSKNRRRESSSLESSKSGSNMSDFVTRGKEVVKDMMPTKRKDKKKAGTTIQEALEILAEEHARQQRITNSERRAPLIRRNSSGSPVPVANIGHIGCLTHLQLTNPDDPDENGDRGYFGTPSFAINPGPNPADAPRTIGQQIHLQLTNPDDQDENDDRGYFDTPSFVTNPDHGHAATRRTVGQPNLCQNDQPEGNANQIPSLLKPDNKYKDTEATIQLKATSVPLSEFFHSCYVNSEDAVASNSPERKYVSGLNHFNEVLEENTTRMNALWSGDELEEAKHGTNDHDGGSSSTEGSVEAPVRTFQERMRDFRARNMTTG